MTSKDQSSTEHDSKQRLTMASTFFHVHHEFRVGKGQQWQETAQAAMALGGGWDEAVANNLEAGFYNHDFWPIGAEGPAIASGKCERGSQRKPFKSSSTDPMA